MECRDFYDEFDCWCDAEAERAAGSGTRPGSVHALPSPATFAASQPRLAEHLSACAACRQWVQDQFALLAAVSSRPGVVVPRGLAECVVERLRGTSPLVGSGGVGSRTSWAAAWAALAAALVIAAMPLWRSSPTGNSAAQVASEPGEQAAGTGGGALASSGPQTDGPDPAALPAPERGAPGNWNPADGTGWSELVLLLPGVPAEDRSGSAGRPPWLDQLDQGLRPISTSASGAWNDLFDALPVGSEPSSL